jgi:hypothetical protein
VQTQFVSDKDCYESSYECKTKKMLHWLENKGIKATFFVVGSLARENTNLIKTIASKAHNIGLHSYTHQPLNKVSKKEFLDGTKESKAFLEDLIGKEILGYRAPYFSLTKETYWVTDELFNLGFRYSSSTIPSNILNVSFPGIPEAPFKWGSGLVEFPMVLSNVMGIRFPSIGGVYLRYIPSSLLAMTLNNTGLRWTYLHPQDIAGKKKFEKISSLGYLASLLYCFNRRSTLSKLNHLVGMHEILDLEEYFKTISIDQLEMYIIK